MHNIKRYANRKLYDTTNKQYITLDKIAKLLKAGEEISVMDNKSGEDITAATVSQILARAKKGQADNAASNVMIQLLRKGPGTLVDYGKKYVSLWDRAPHHADEEIERLVERLIKEKEITPSEGTRLKKDMLNRAEDMKKWIAEKIDHRVNEALDLMNLASKDQVSQLTSKIDALNRKVQKLEKMLARKAEEEKVEKAAEPIAKEARTKIIPLPKDDPKPVNLTEKQGSKTLKTAESPDHSA